MIINKTFKEDRFKINFTEKDKDNMFKLLVINIQLLYKYPNYSEFYLENVKCILSKYYMF